MFSITLNAIVMFTIFVIVVVCLTKLSLLVKDGPLYDEDDINKDIASNYGGNK